MRDRNYNEEGNGVENESEQNDINEGGYQRKGCASAGSPLYTAIIVAVLESP